MAPWSIPQTIETNQKQAISRFHAILAFSPCQRSREDYNVGPVVYKANENAMHKVNLKRYRPDNMERCPSG